jgi:Helix-loop-helix DNA-binding domain
VEDWDLDLGDITAPIPEFQASVPPTDNSFSPNLLQQLESANIPDYQSQPALTAGLPSYLEDILDRSRIVAGKQRAYEQSGRGGRPPGRRSKLFGRPSGQVGNTTPGTISLGRMQQLQDDKAPPNLNSNSPAVSRSTASPKSSDRFATTWLASSRQPDDQTTPPPQPKDKRYHKDTERQYHLRPNQKFSALLKALPDDLVESASSHPGRSQADKALTKIEILALAKSYIASLEKTQTELEEESLVLRGRQELFKRLFGGGMGDS